MSITLKGLGGAVDSVNGKTGVVVLSPEDLGADSAGAASAVIVQHEAAADPHPQYLTETEADAKYAAIGSGGSGTGGDPAGTAEALLAAHEAAADPHPQYLTQSDGDAQYAPQTHAHTSSQISDFSEVVEGIIGGSIAAGDGVSVDYNDSTGKTTISASGGGSGTSKMIRTPVAVTPLTGTTDFPVDGTLQASSYAPLYSADTREFREFQIDTAAGDFTNPVAAAQVNADVWVISPAIPDNTDLQWRCRDKSVKGDYSEWSEPQTFKTHDIYVVTPVILSPTEGGGLPATGQPVTTSAFQMVNSEDTHAASYWTVKDSLGAVAYQTGRDTVNLTSWQPPAGVIVDGESMTVEVVYESSGGYVSEAGARGFVGVASSFGEYLAVAHNVTPFVTNYGMDVDDFTKLVNPSGLPTSNGRCVAFSSDGTYMAVGHELSPFITVYKRSGDTFTKLANPDVLPTNAGLGVAFSPDGTYMAVAHFMTPFLAIYRRSGDTFTKLANPDVLPTGTGRAVAFSSDGNYMAVGHDSSPFITTYKRSGDTFTKLANPSGLPTSNAFGVAFSSDGTYMAVGHTSSPFITVYKRSGDTFTKLANPSGLPTGEVRGVAFSSDGTYMAVAHFQTPCLAIYKRSGDTFTKLANPDVLPVGNAFGVAFSSDGTYMAVGHELSPFITVYKRSGDTFTKLANPDVLPTGLSVGVAFWPSALYPYPST